MSSTAIQALIGTALLDREFCKELLNGKRSALLAEFDLTDEEREIVLGIETDSIQEFAERLYEWLKNQENFTVPWSASTVSTRHLSDKPSEQLLAGKVGQDFPDETSSDVEAFLIESLAHGLLGICGVKEPPVPVQEMLQHSLSIFEHLSLLELSLGLYDVAYRSLLNGSRVIVIDLNHPLAVQRAGVARELYVAFCCSSRAAELHWPAHKKSNTYSDFFARCLMMPAVWVQQAQAETTPLEDLANRFGVPVQMAAQRLNELK